MPILVGSVLRLRTRPGTQVHIGASAEVDEKMAPSGLTGSGTSSGRTPASRFTHPLLASARRSITSTSLRGSSSRNSNASTCLRATADATAAS